MATEFAFPEAGAKAASAAEQEFQTEKMSLSMGPSHPSTHGVLRLQMDLDGEVVTKCDPVIGYLHRGDEKIAENMTYNQFVPYTDRLDYLAPLANNVAYAIAVDTTGTVTIGGAAAGASYLTSVTGALTTEFPGVTSTVTIEGEQAGIRRLCNGELDLIAAAGELTQ